MLMPAPSAFLLKTLLDFRPLLAEKPHWSICSRVRAACITADVSLSSIKEKLHALFTKWPHFSGILEFPIPSTIPSEDAAHCYWSVLTTLCNSQTPPANLLEQCRAYTDLRLDLLEFCIAQLSAELSKPAEE